MLPDKHAVHQALQQTLTRALETMVDAARQTREGAVHEESRAEGDKDMRSTEQSYLARGQAMRAEALAEELTRLRTTAPRVFRDDDPIAPGALARVSVDDVERVFFVLPVGAGTELDLDGVRITVVSPSSPIGAALLGRRPGDDFELVIRGKRREHVVEAVA